MSDLRLKWALFANLGVLALQGLAFAQAAPTQAESQAAPAQADGPLEEVKVTGSRVISNGNDSPTPVTVVTTDQIQAVQPSRLADNLNDLPVFSGSRGQTSNPDPSSNGGGNGAASELNMRNLGANRNLILFDGHRVPATLTDGTVDIDMIPQMLIQRVEMVTGGTSAVYGSDAVSGVVNFITDTKFNGVKFQTQGGISNYGDDATEDVGIAAGGLFLDNRLHLEGSFEYRNSAGILYRTDRSWGDQWAAEGAGTAAAPYELVSNTRLANYTFGGLITGKSVLAGQTFQSNGLLSPFVAGKPTGSSCCQVGGDGAYYDSSLVAPLTSKQMFGRADYDISDKAHAYLVFSGNIKEETQYANPPQLSNVTISATNALLPASYQAALAAAKQTTFTLSEIMSDDAPRLATETDANQFFVNGGLRGEIDGYNWDLSYVHGWNRMTDIVHNNLNVQNLAAALDVVNGPNGPECYAATVNAAYSKCVPLNPFGPTAASAAAVNYILANTNYVTDTTMNDVAASITGAPFSDWAGPVTMALSGEWRNLNYSITSNATQLMNCTSLRYNCSSTSSDWFLSIASRTPVGENVSEGAYEFDAPLVKDVPFIQALSLNGAVRETFYSVSGDYTTWKLGLDWHVNDDFTLRGTGSRDIRAPTLADLYAPTTVTTLTNTDLLTGLSKAVPAYSSGNPHLTAEIGHTFTGGFVWQPHFMPGFSLSLDGYHIKITNAISSELGYNTLIQQACYASGGSSQYCALQSRPLGYTNTSAANAVSAWYDEEFNISWIETYGGDLEANYNTTVVDRPLTLRTFVNWQPHLLFVTPGLSTLDHAGVAYSTGSLYPAPRVSATLLAHMGVTHDTSVDLMERWRSPYTLRDQPGQVWINPSVPSFYTTAVTLTYSVAQVKTGDLDVFLNVQNLFNRQPPPAASYGSQTTVGQYGGFAIGDDPVGRYFTLGVHFRY